MDHEKTGDRDAQLYIVRKNLSIVPFLCSFMTNVAKSLFSGIPKRTSVDETASLILLSFLRRTSGSNFRPKKHYFALRSLTRIITV
jgi:hypothetical protein